MEHTVNRILHDLHIISQISIGDKISTSSEHIDINREGIMQSIMRTIYRDSRMKTYSCIADTIHISMAMMTLLMESTHVREDTGSICYSSDRYHTLYSLYSALSGSTRGIENLITTYHSDAAMDIQLNKLLEEQTEFVATCKEFLGISDIS